MGVETEEKKGSEDEDDWWESMMPKPPEPKKNKRRKSDNRNGEEDWTEEEMKVLVEEVTKREEALFGDIKEDESPCKRWRFWLEVADKVNDVSIKHRNVEKVRIKWFEHKNPKQKYCNLRKSALLRRINYKPVSERRYWRMRRKISNPSPVISDFQSATEFVATPTTQPTSQPITQHKTQQVLNTTAVGTIQQLENNYPTEHDDAFGPYGEPLRSNRNVPGPHGESLGSGESKDQNYNSSEDVVIVDEVATKNSNREYEVIVLDDEDTTNEGEETASRKEGTTATNEYIARFNDGKESSRMTRKQAEEERVKEWLMLTDEERKARVKQILNNLKDTPKPSPQRIVSRPKPCVKRNIEHFLISMPKDAAVKFPPPPLENFKDTNLPSEENTTKASGVPLVSQNESSSDTNPTRSSDTNPSESGETDPSGCKDTNASGSSDINPSASNDTNSSGSIGTKPSKSCDTVPSGNCETSSSGITNMNSPGSNLGKITEIFSMASAEEFQNLPCSSSVVLKKSGLIQDKSIDKLGSQPPPSETIPPKFPAILSVSPSEKPKDSSPLPTSESSQLIAISSAIPVQKFQIVQPLPENSSNIKAVVPVSQQAVPSVIDMPQIVGEQVIVEKEGGKANNANLKDSSSRADDNSSKTITSSSTSINTGSELLREIFGVDAVEGNLLTCEQPAELVKTIESHSSIKSVSSVCQKAETNAKCISNDNAGADTRKAGNNVKLYKKVVSKSISHKKYEQTTSSESICDGLKQITEKPTKVYPGKCASQKRVMHAVPSPSENDQKQTPQPSYYIDLTKKGCVVTQNPKNPDWIEIKDSASGKSFLMAQDKLSNVQIQKEKSVICSQKGDKLNILFNPTANTKIINEVDKLKVQFNNDPMLKPSSMQRSILPQMPKICLIQGKAIHIPELQNVKTLKRPPILLRKIGRNFVSKPPASVILVPPQFVATTSGIQKESKVSLKPVLPPDTEQPIPVSIHKAGDASLNLTKQSSTQESVPVAIHKFNDGSSGDAVASQKSENVSPMKDSSVTTAAVIASRKRARKDLGIPRRTTILKKEPIVLLERLSIKKHKGYF